MDANVVKINLVAAIKSLDTLNDQIIQFIFSSSGTTPKLDLSGYNQKALQSSMVLLKKLLEDSQRKFRNMMEDNIKLAAKIDSSIHLANKEVNNLREELVDTNRRLTQMCDVRQGSKPTNNTPTKESSRRSEKTKNKDWRYEKEVNHLRQQNALLQTQLNNLKQELKNSEDKCASNDVCESCTRLSMTPYTQKQQSGENATDESKVNQLRSDLLLTRQELERAKEALYSIKTDRKRLKAEKIDLLNQMKQLYSTLDDKESELREFIRTYEKKMKETDASLKQFALEKEDCEHEKWEILKRARDAAERSVALRAELDLKDQHIKKLDTQLAQAHDKLNALGQNPASGSGSRDQLSSSAEDILIPYRQIPPPPDPPRMYRSDDSAYASYAHTQSNGSIGNIQGLAESTKSSEEFGETIYSQIAPLNTSTQSSNTPSQNTSFTNPSPTSHNVTKKKRRSFGTLSKMFSKTRSRRSIAVSDPSILEENGDCLSPRLSVLTPENYQEKLALLEKAKQLRMEHWKASYILAWIEIEINMPAYGKACAENIKSGQILLGLNDSELDSALKLSSPLHRKKLRLAIEEIQNPALSLYKKAAHLDHTWVSHMWVRDLGLQQYCSIFEHHLIDGRLLNVLSKKDLEKHIGMTRKFHQVSILHGIELLRILHFDKETLLDRRRKCEDNNNDPLVWSNQRLIKWVRDIDLEEYADNLLESGVHGAMLVLESSFNMEAMAAALTIPQGKSYVRRHLAAELDALVKPARAALEFATHISKKKPTKPPSGGSLSRSFLRSYKGGLESPEQEQSRTSKKISFRGSLGRALGKKNKSESDSYVLPPVYNHRNNQQVRCMNTRNNVIISKPVTLPSSEIEAEGTTV